MIKSTFRSVLTTVGIFPSFLWNGLSYFIQDVSNSVFPPLNVFGGIINLMIPFMVIFLLLGLLFRFFHEFSRMFSGIFGSTRSSRSIIGTPDNPRLIEKKMVEFEPKEPPKLPEPEIIIREDFFCQMDNDTHTKTDNAYQCQQCLRFVCESCFDVMNQQGFSNCPYCRNRLLPIRGNYCLSEPLIYKGVITI